MESDRSKAEASEAERKAGYLPLFWTERDDHVHRLGSQGVDHFECREVSSCTGQVD